MFQISIQTCLFISYGIAKDVNSALFKVTNVMSCVVSSQNIETSTKTHAVKLGANTAGVYYTL